MALKLKKKTKKTIAMFSEALFHLAILALAFSIIMQMVQVYMPEEGEEEVNLLIDPNPFICVIFYAALTLAYVMKAFNARNIWPKWFICYMICAAMYATCSVLFAATDYLTAMIAVGYTHASAAVLEQIFALVHRHKVRDIIFRLLMIALISFIKQPFFLLLFLLVIPQSLGRIAKLCFSRVKFDVMRKIIRKTYAAEIIFGLVFMIVAFSIVLFYTESSIPTFEDALWYCFAIVTTIGFGDFTAVGLIGRVLSVVLGIYGIIVVALITSIVVNFYNETKDDPEDDEDKMADDPDALFKFISDAGEEDSKTEEKAEEKIASEKSKTDIAKAAEGEAEEKKEKETE